MDKKVMEILENRMMSKKEKLKKLDDLFFNKCTINFDDYIQGYDKLFRRR